MKYHIQLNVIKSSIWSGKREGTIEIERDKDVQRLERDKER